MLETRHNRDCVAAAAIISSGTSSGLRNEQANERRSCSMSAPRPRQLVPPLRGPMGRRLAIGP